MKKFKKSIDFCTNSVYTRYIKRKVVDIMREILIAYKKGLVADWEIYLLAYKKGLITEHEFGCLI